MEGNEDRDKTGGQGEEGLHDDDFPEIPDGIGSFEELEQHLSGDPEGKKKDDGKQGTVTVEAFNELKTRLEEFNTERQGLVDIIGRLAAARDGGRTERGSEDLNFFPDIEDPETSVPSVTQLNKALGGLMNVIQQGFASLSTVATKPDYTDVVNSHLPGLLKERPELSTALQKGNMQAIQYHLASLYKALKEGKGGPGDGDSDGDDAATNVQTILRNFAKPGSSSKAKTPVPSSKGKWVDNLDDESFGKLINAVIDGRVSIGGISKGG